MSKDELIALLTNDPAPGDTEVILSSDAEGNAYYSVCGIEDAYIEADDQHIDGVWDEDDMKDIRESNPESVDSFKKVVVVYPS